MVTSIHFLQLGKMPMFDIYIRRTISKQKSFWQNVVVQLVRWYISEDHIQSKEYSLICLMFAYQKDPKIFTQSVEKAESFKFPVYRHHKKEEDWFRCEKDFIKLHQETTFRHIPVYLFCNIFISSSQLCIQSVNHLGNLLCLVWKWKRKSFW